VIRIDPSKCKGDDLCTLVCPAGVIEKGPVLHPEAATFCISCGHCHAVCPQDAITVEGFEGPEILAAPQAPPVSAASLLAFLRARRSCRRYQERPVSREHIEAIIEAASLAPSACNGRPTKAYVVADPERLEALREGTLSCYRRVLRSLRRPGIGLLWRLLGFPARRRAMLVRALEYLLAASPGGDRLFYGAPALLIFTLPRNDPVGRQDAPLAAQNAALQAEALGVGACFNGYFEAAAHRDRSIPAIAGIPPAERIAIALTLGYPKGEPRFLRPAPRKTMETVWI